MALDKIQKQMLEQDVQTELDKIPVLNEKQTELTSQLAQKANFISVKSYENLKVAIAEGYDWSPSINQAIVDARTTMKKIVIHADEDIYITQPIKPDVSSKIVGFGKFNSIIRPVGAIKAIDISSAGANTGLEISSLAIVGDKTQGQVGIDAYYVTNGSHIHDIRIENVDIGMRINKCWYGAFSNIFMRGNVTYNMHVISASSTEQVNAISFKSIFMQGAINSVFLDGVNVAAAVKFDSCTFEKSKKTAVVSNGFAPLKFDNCYFESNYSDGATTDTLTWQTPIDVKVTSTGARNQVKFDSCYFARNSNFLTSSQKTGIYIGADVKPTIENCTFVCNTSDYLDAQIYSESQYYPSIRNCSEEGFAKELYKGIQKEEVIAFDKDFNLRYTSTLDTIQGYIGKTGTYYLKFTPHTTGTVSNNAMVKMERLSDGTQIGLNLAFTTSFTKDQPWEKLIGNLNAGTTFKLTGYTATTTDMIGSLAIVRKHID